MSLATPLQAGKSHIRHTSIALKVSLLMTSISPAYSTTVASVHLLLMLCVMVLLMLRMGMILLLIVATIPWSTVVIIKTCTHQRFWCEKKNGASFAWNKFLTCDKFIQHKLRNIYPCSNEAYWYTFFSFSSREREKTPIKKKTFK